MNKIILTLVFIFASTSISLAQAVSINNNGAAADSKAILDVSASNKGILIPRLDFNSLPESPATSLLVYITANGPDGENRIYYYNGSDWVAFTDGENVFKNENSDYYENTRDLIINTRLSVGYDAVNNENFGTDVLRLKENNLRIAFLDVSEGAFPGNDWILEANSNENGGTNHIAIVDSSAGNTRPFVVIAGNSSNSLYIKQNYIGNLTDSPQKSFHTVKGTTPSIRIEQDISQANVAQVFDIGGDETQFIIKENTTSSIPFAINSAAPSNSLYIKSNGNVGVNTNDPQRQLHVNGDMRFTPQALAPGTPSAGDIYFDDNDKKMKCYDGTQWQDLW